MRPNFKTTSGSGLHRGVPTLRLLAAGMVLVATACTTPFFRTAPGGLGYWGHEHSTSKLACTGCRTEGTRTTCESCYGRFSRYGEENNKGSCVFTEEGDMVYRDCTPQYVHASATSYSYDPPGRSKTTCTGCEAGSDGITCLECVKTDEWGESAKWGKCRVFPYGLGSRKPDFLCSVLKSGQRRASSRKRTGSKAAKRTPVVPSGVKRACESGHFIQKNAGGRIIILGDGSRWEVLPGGDVVASIWLPASEVIACPGELFNVFTGERVGAMQVGHSPPTRRSGGGGYMIEAASNDEVFIINGETFEAKVYCLGWEEGDRVRFIDGSPYGVCVTATLFNLNRDETCEVWCE